MLKLTNFNVSWKKLIYRFVQLEYQLGVSGNPSS